MCLTFFMYRAIFLGKIFSCAFLVQKLINTYNRLILSCPLCLTGIASTTTMSILRLDGERSLPLNHQQFFSSRWTHWNSQLSNYTPPDISPQTYCCLFSVQNSKPWFRKTFQNIQIKIKQVRQPPHPERGQHQNRVPDGLCCWSWSERPSHWGAGGTWWWW